MSWNDGNATSSTGQRIRWIVIGAGGAALFALGLVLATRQYDAHAPNESPPPPGAQPAGANGASASGGATPATASAAGSSTAGAQTGGPAAATMQNLIPGAGNTRVLGQAGENAPGVAGFNAAGAIVGQSSAGGAAGPGLAFGQAQGAYGQRAPINGLAAPSGGGAILYPAGPAPQPGATTPRLPYPAIASPPTLAPSAGAVGRAGAGPGMAPSAPGRPG